MKNDIIRFENNVPDNYLVGSRDYQALLRLFTFGISSIKFDVDNIRYVNDASHINSRLLNLLKLKVGFFTKEEFKDQYIREVLKVFSLIVKKKGTRQAIYDAINLYFRACRYNGDYVVEINNKDDIQPYMIRIGVTKESNDILLLEEILKYILPTGYLYEVFKYSTAKYKSNYYSQDIVTLSVIDDYNGSNIHSNSSNVFIEKLYEGISVGPASIITITDGADNTPLKSTVVNIEPVQDLHGYSYPWPGGGGVNLLPPIASDQSVTQNNLTVTLKTDGTLTIVGKLDSGTTFFNAFTLSGAVDVDTSHYIYLFNNQNSSKMSISFRNSSSTTITAAVPAEANKKVAFTASGTVAILAVFVNSTVQLNMTMKPMIAKSNSVTAWTPYSNISPISGFDSVKVSRTGKNLIPNLTGTRTSESIYIGQVDSTTYSVHLFAGIPYTLTYTANGTSPTAYYKEDGGANLLWGESGTTKTFDKDLDIQMWIYASGVTSVTDFQLEIGSTATPYEPYVGDTYPIPLGRTVYGGTLDVVRGKLVVDRAMITLDGSQNVRHNGATAITSRFICGISGKASGETNIQSNIFRVNTSATDFVGKVIGRLSSSFVEFYLPISVAQTDAAGKQWFADNPTQVVYELATPQEYNLTPQTIRTLLGTNNIWADAGDTSLEYLSETSGGNYINYYNVYNNVTDNYINILTYPSVDNIELYNGDFTVSVSVADFDLDNANMYVLVHQYLKDDRIVCGKTTWSISYDVQTDSITATSGNNEINISYSNFIRNLPLLEDHEIPSSFTLEYENESISTEGFVLQDDNRSFTFTGYDGNKIIVKYETDSQYLGKRIDNVVVYKNGWENESD